MKFLSSENFVVYSIALKVCLEDQYSIRQPSSMVAEILYMYLHQVFQCYLCSATEHPATLSKTPLTEPAQESKSVCCTCFPDHTCRCLQAWAYQGNAWVDDVSLIKSGFTTADNLPKWAFGGSLACHALAYIIFYRCQWSWSREGPMLVKGMAIHDRTYFNSWALNHSFVHWSLNSPSYWWLITLLSMFSSAVKHLALPTISPCWTVHARVYKFLCTLGTC